MAKINDLSKYPLKTSPVLADYLIGTDSETVDKESKNFQIGDILNLGIINGYYIEKYTVQTLDATQTDIAAISLDEGKIISIEIDVLGQKSDETQMALYKISALFYRNTGGNVTQQGYATSINTIETDSNWDADIFADTVNQTVDVRVTGVAATTINWQAIVKYHIL